MIIIFNPPYFIGLPQSILLVYIGNLSRPVFNRVLITFSNDGILGGGKDDKKVTDMR